MISKCLYCQSAPVHVLVVNGKTSSAYGLESRVITGFMVHSEMGHAASAWCVCVCGALPQLREFVLRS